MDNNIEVLRAFENYVPVGYVSDINKELVVARGRGSFFWDCNGKRYIDFTSGVFTNTFGHCYPPLVLASLRQNLLMDNVHARRTKVELSFYKRLSGFVTGGYRFIPYNDGGYAIDRGLSDILNYYNKQRVAIGAFRGGFHGKTMGAKLTINETQKASLFDNFQMEYPYCYRCPQKKTPQTCRMECADAVCEVLCAKDAKAILFEPIQGAGIIIPPKGFWQKIEKFCKPRGILLFADEVLTAGGRTGYFLASHDYYGINPDMIAITKGLANGHPLSVLCETERITNNPYAMRPGERFSTFAAHPQGLAIAAVVLEHLDKQDILKKVREKELLLKEALAEIKDTCKAVGDARSIGLMGALEFVTGSDTAPCPEIGRRVFEAARQSGVELIYGGHILRLAPPLNISYKALREGLTLLLQSIRKASTL